MSDYCSDAKIRRMYRRLEKAKRQLEVSRHDANRMGKDLRVLADCFDEDNDARITAVRDGQFYSTYPDAQYDRIGKDWPGFADEAGKLAQDNLDLAKVIEEMKKGLSLEIGCL